MRPTRFIIQHIDELSEGVQNDKEILARFMEPAFQDKFKKSSLANGLLLKKSL